jgi:Fur family iron response transcriptional regulator
MNTHLGLTASGDLETLLRGRGISPTAQRLAVARVVFSKKHHLSADDVYTLVSKTGADVSRATIYNTLGLFVDKRLVKPVVVGAGKVFYDSNMTRHHHFYDSSSDQLTDIDKADIAMRASISSSASNRRIRIDIIRMTSPA